MFVLVLVVLTPGVSHEIGDKKPPAKAAKPEKKTAGDWFLFNAVQF